MAIARGDCRSAIIGGTNILLTPSGTTAISDLGVLSKDGSCKTFSANANGYARGEAIVAIYIKSLSDAIRDGNPVRAVIRGTSTNCDGKTAGVTLPSADGQEAVIRKAYKIAGISNMSETAFVECHGTGTRSVISSTVDVFVAN
jgi:acyl transferase domain-containing protein